MKTYELAGWKIEVDVERTMQENIIFWEKLSQSLPQTLDLFKKRRLSLLTLPLLQKGFSISKCNWSVFRVFATLDLR